MIYNMKCEHSNFYAFIGAVVKSVRRRLAITSPNFAAVDLGNHTAARDTMAIHCMTAAQIGVWSRAVASVAVYGMRAVRFGVR